MTSWPPTSTVKAGGGPAGTGDLLGLRRDDLVRLGRSVADRGSRHACDRTFFNRAAPQRRDDARAHVVHLTLSTVTRWLLELGALPPLTWLSLLARRLRPG